jgi:hypothetical protein
MSINSNLAVMRNAFSTAAVNPKVPDGKVSCSSAMREATCNVHTFGAAVVTTTFVLTPQLSHVLSIYPQTAAVAAAGTTAAVAASYNADSIVYHKHNPELLNTNIGQGNHPDKWRVVSCALRLSCVNAAEYNNGWFEAIRYSPKVASFEATPAGANAGMHRLRVNAENDLLLSSSWANSPSYVTGKLANLYKHQFNLHSVGDREYITASTTSYLDDFDCILVRVHAAVQSTTAPAAAIHFHTVTNYETVYDAGAAMSRFHTPSHSNYALVKKVDSAIKRDPKASVIRSPSSYAYQP